MDLNYSLKRIKDKNCGLHLIPFLIYLNYNKSLLHKNLKYASIKIGLNALRVTEERL